MQRLATPAVPDRVIELKALEKRYRTVTALAGVSLSIDRGNIYGLVGSNGAGKTTMIRTLLGLIKPTAGRVTVLGQNIVTHANRIRPRIGYVPENHYLYSWMTVEGLLDFVRPFYPSWNRALCRDLLDLLNIDPTRRIKALSKGTVVKLALVIAVAHEPALLILDEPTSGLDPLVRADFLDVLHQRHRATGQTILFSSHILSDIQALATHVGILHAGRLLADGTVDQLQGRTRVIRVSAPADGRQIVPPPKTLWQSQKGAEHWLAVADCDEAVVEEVAARNPAGVIGVRDVTLDEVYLYHVRGTGHHAAAALEGHSA